MLHSVARWGERWVWSAERAKSFLFLLLRVLSFWKAPRAWNSLPASLTRLSLLLPAKAELPKRARRRPAALIATGPATVISPSSFPLRSATVDSSVP